MQPARFGIEIARRSSSGRELTQCIESLDDAGVTRGTAAAQVIKPRYAQELYVVRGVARSRYRITQRGDGWYRSRCRSLRIGQLCDVGARSRGAHGDATRDGCFNTDRDGMLSPGHQIEA